jgi:hypothetical protein
MNLSEMEVSTTTTTIYLLVSAVTCADKLSTSSQPSTLLMSMSTSFFTWSKPILAR